MSERSLLADTQFHQAFLANEQQERINTGKVASALVLILMPFGSSLDFFICPDKLGYFFGLRIACSVLAGVIWWLFTRPFGQRHYRSLGLPIALLPAFFISWMIYVKDGPVSPYYAGLNLILLAVSVVVHWTVLESSLAVVSMLAMYLVACLLHATHAEEFQLPKVFYSNLIFMFETGVIVIVGNYIFNRLRFREFVLRYELDKNRKALEQKTVDLEDAIVRLKEAEAELVQTEKLASLGRMSAGIIHEINNPLNYAKTGLYTLKNKAKYLPAEQQPVYGETIQDVEDGLDRVKNIVSDLRGFTTQSDDVREEVSVADLVDASVRFVSHEWGDVVQLQKNVPKEHVIHANKNKLIQVCVNLLENSLDALKQKEFANGEQPTVTIESRIEDGLNILRFHDNGPGIKGENLSKIFDPFFTTKDVGEGMGLGLSICYRIIQESGGQIRVKSEPAKFCEFALEFSLKG